MYQSSRPPAAPQNESHPQPTGEVFGVLVPEWRGLARKRHSFYVTFIKTLYINSDDSGSNHRHLAALTIDLHAAAINLAAGESAGASPRGCSNRGQILNRLAMDIGAACRYQLK